MTARNKKDTAVAERRQREKVVDFDPVGLRAPFLLRCAAAAIDYIVLIVCPVAWLLLSEMLSDGSAGVSVASISWYFGILLTILNLFVAPLWRGQSIGKMVTGITILRTDGTHPVIRNILLRNLAGYSITLLTLGLGFLIAAVNNSGRALHDFIGGTVVIRGRRSRL